MSLIFPNPPVTAGFSSFDNGMYTKIYKNGSPSTFSINEPNIQTSGITATGIDAVPTNYYTQLSKNKWNCTLTSNAQGGLLTSSAGGGFLLQPNADIFIQCLCFVENLTNNYRPCFGFYEKNYGGASGPGSISNVRALYLGRDTGESFYHVGVSQGVGSVTKTPTTIPFDANPALFLLEYDIKNNVIAFKAYNVNINTGQKTLVATTSTAQFTTAMSPFVISFVSDTAAINASSFFGLAYASFKIRSKKIDLS